MDNSPQKIQCRSLKAGNRVSAAGNLLPYEVSKLGTRSVRHFIEEATPIEPPANIADAIHGIGLVTFRMAKGQTTFESGSGLIAGFQAFINAMDTGAIAKDGRGMEPQTIRIIGGMDHLPGSDVIMRAMLRAWSNE